MNQDYPPVGEEELANYEASRTHRVANKLGEIAMYVGMPAVIGIGGAELAIHLRGPSVEEAARIFATVDILGGIAVMSFKSMADRRREQ